MGEKEKNNGDLKEKEVCLYVISFFCDLFVLPYMSLSCSLFSLTNIFNYFVSVESVGTSELRA